MFVGEGGRRGEGTLHGLPEGMAELRKSCLGFSVSAPLQEGRGEAGRRENREQMIL